MLAHHIIQCKGQFQKDFQLSSAWRGFFFWLITRFAHHSTDAITHLPSFVSAASPRPPQIRPSSNFQTFYFCICFGKRKNAIGFHFETREPKLTSSQVTDLGHTFIFQRWSNGSCFSPRRRSDIRLFSLHSDYE